MRSIHVKVGKDPESQKQIIVPVDDVMIHTYIHTYRIACNFRGVKISFILKKEIFVSKNFVLPGSGRGRRRPTRFFVGEKFRGGQLTHENKEIFTPRKLHAIRYIQTDRQNCNVED